MSRSAGGRRWQWRRALVGSVLAAVAAGSALAAAPAPIAVGVEVEGGGSCSAPRPGEVGCAAEWVDPDVDPNVVHPGELDGLPVAGYRPADLASLYRLDTLRGRGVTVAVIEAYDNPNAESDLAVYRSTFGLPACTTANKCFRKRNQRGGTVWPAPADSRWAVESALDLQAVSAVCPKCKLLLVEAETPSLGDIAIAVDRAVKLGADIVSNSYGTPEFTRMTDYEKYYAHEGVTMVAAAGDNGYPIVDYPAVLPSVIAVGGTSVRKLATGKWQEAAWSGSGGGCSTLVAKPAWQKDTGCAMRTLNDVAAIADPATGLAIYVTFGLTQGGWIVGGGTSLATPVVAGMIALAGTHESYPDASRLYELQEGRYDVLKGSNGTCSGSYLCMAGRGYDGPTGLGAPRGKRGL